MIYHFLNTEQSKGCLGAHTTYAKNTQAAEAVNVAHPHNVNPYADIKNYWMPLSKGKSSMEVETKTACWTPCSSTPKQRLKQVSYCPCLRTACFPKLPKASKLLTQHLHLSSNEHLKLNLSKWELWHPIYKHVIPPFFNTLHQMAPSQVKLLRYWGHLNFYWILYCPHSQRPNPFANLHLLLKCILSFFFIFALVILVRSPWSPLDPWTPSLYFYWTLLQIVLYSVQRTFFSKLHVTTMLSFALNLKLNLHSLPMPYKAWTFWSPSTLLLHLTWSKFIFTKL